MIWRFPKNITDIEFYGPLCENLGQFKPLEYYWKNKDFDKARSLRTPNFKKAKNDLDWNKIKCSRLE